MQINMAGYNAQLRITANNVSNSKANAGFGNCSMNTGMGAAFGTQCKVTISQEGKKKSEQAKQSAGRSIMEMQAERMLIRQQEQAEQYKSEHSDTLDEIAKLMQSIQNSYDAGEDKETIQKKQDALNRMMELKKRQEEENEQRVKDAMKGVSGSSKEQEEIDRKNEALLMLLKSLEEQEDGNGTTGKEGASETSKDEQSGAGAQIQESAAIVGASAARRELQTKGAIDELKNDGYGKLAEVNEMMHGISEELRSAQEAAQKENLSEKEREQLVSEHTGMARAMLMSNYGYMTELRRKGLQEVKDSRELEMRHIEINPLDGVKRAQQTILGAGVDAAFQEAAAGVLDKASQELEDRVQAEIDKRNDITPDSDQKTEEEAEEIEEKRAEEEIEEKQEEKNSILDELII